MSFLEVTQGSLGQVNNNLQNVLANNAAMNQGQQSQMNNNLNYVSGANQAAINSMYGPQGFGGATAQAAATGAAYGRAVGGGADIYAPSGSVFDTGAPAYNDYGNKGGSYGGFGGEGATPAPLVGVPQQAPQANVGMQTVDPIFTENYPNQGVSTPAPPPAYDWNGYFSGLTAPVVAAAGGGNQSKNPFSSGGPSMTFDADGNFTGWDFSGGGGHPAVPAAAPAPSPGYTPDPNTASMNGFGYPGPAGSVSQAFNPASYAPSTTGNAGAVLGGGSASGGYKPFAAGGPSMTFGPDGEFTGWDFSGSNAPSYNYAGATPPNPQSVLGYTPDQYLNGPDYGGAGTFDPSSFANRFAAGGYYQPGTPSQQSGGSLPGTPAYDPLSGQAPPYTYQPYMIQGPGGPGDWIPQGTKGDHYWEPSSGGAGGG